MKWSMILLFLAGYFFGLVVAGAVTSYVDGYHGHRTPAGLVGYRHRHPHNV